MTKHKHRGNDLHKISNKASGKHECNCPFCYSSFSIAYEWYIKLGNLSKLVQVVADLLIVHYLNYYVEDMRRYMQITHSNKEFTADI